MEDRTRKDSPHPSDDRCACGEPLHYRDDRTRAEVEKLVAELGETVLITTRDGTWKVPRHYIALHGIKAWELPYLAGTYGWQKVEEGDFRGHHD